VKICWFIQTFHLCGY